MSDLIRIYKDDEYFCDKLGLYKAKEFIKELSKKFPDIKFHHQSTLPCEEEEYLNLLKRGFNSSKYINLIEALEDELENIIDMAYELNRVDEQALSNQGYRTVYGSFKVQKNILKEVALRILN